MMGVMRMPRVLTALASSLLLAGAAACGSGQEASIGSTSGASPTPTTDTAATAAGSPTATASRAAAAPKRGAVRTVATGLEVPWDIAFLPDGDALVSERDNARILQLDAADHHVKSRTPIPGVVPNGEGGLLGLAVSPDYATDHRVYAYFSAQSDNRVVRIDWETKAVTPILTGLRHGAIHNGGALQFGPDGDLYVGVGETGDTSLAQSKSTRNGKILRITTSGKVPAGNPFKGSPIWSYGHRNVQGLAWDGKGRLWASEFGQDTTDEVNLIRKGHDYGWPIVEGKGSTQGGKFTNPVVTWSPTSTSSPSGAAIAGNELYVGALAGRKLWRIKLKGTKAGKPQALFSGKYGRIRAVAKAPDGSIWFSTSNRDGRGSPAASDDRIFQLGT